MRSSTKLLQYMENSEPDMKLSNKNPEFVEKFSSLKPTTTAGTNQNSRTNPIEYRNLQIKDINEVAELCCEVFDGPYEWHQLIQKKMRIETLKSELSDRYYNMIKKGKKHAMIVSIQSENVIGFMEVGMLPNPIKEKEKDLNMTITASVWFDEKNNQFKTVQLDVPYLGNVAVNKNYRRKGIASSMIRIGLKIVEKWNDESLYVAVDYNNDNAIKLYQKLNFEIILNETNYGNNNNNNNNNIKSRNNNEKIPRLYMRRLIRHANYNNNNSDDNK
eukprot:gene9411-12674_t